MPRLQQATVGVSASTFRRPHCCVCCHCQSPWSHVGLDRRLRPRGPRHSHWAIPACRLVGYSQKGARVDQVVPHADVNKSLTKVRYRSSQSCCLECHRALSSARCCFCCTLLSCSTSSRVPVLSVTRTLITLKCTSVLRPRLHRPLFCSACRKFHLVC